MTRLVVDNIGKRFSCNVVFRRLSFTLEGSSALAVTGPNGSGKSTLLKILAGLQRPTKGMATLYVNGRALDTEAHVLKAGLVAPDYNVYEDLTARENLKFLARGHGLPDVGERIDRLLSFVALAECGDDYVHSFSSGMKQRMKFAATLLSDPPLLLLDEPNVSLDENGRELVSQIVTRQLDAGGILVLATNVAEEVVDFTTVLSIGEFGPAKRGECH